MEIGVFSPRLLAGDGRMCCTGDCATADGGGPEPLIPPQSDRIPEDPPATAGAVAGAGGPAAETGVAPPANDVEMADDHGAGAHDHGAMAHDHSEVAAEGGGPVEAGAEAAPDPAAATGTGAEVENSTDVAPATGAADATGAGPGDLASVLQQLVEVLQQLQEVLSSFAASVGGGGGEAPATDATEGSRAGVMINTSAPSADAAKGSVSLGSPTPVTQPGDPELAA